MGVSEEHKICLPGDRLFKIGRNEYRASMGTFERQGFIISTLAGFVHLKQLEDGNLVEVLRDAESSYVHSVPFVGAIVTCKVLSINNKFAKCQITAVESSHLKSNFTGMIRKEDIRSVDKDRAEVHKSFRPGDCIVARVLALGDSYSFLLTTAEDELGVVSGKCDEGHAMVPVNWVEMECRNCETRYQRKMAKVPHITIPSAESKGKET